MKHLIKTSFFIAITFSMLFISCKDDNENSPVPCVNKNKFSLEHITDADTLYTTDSSSFTLRGFYLRDGSSDEVICDVSLIDKETTISDGKKIIGEVVYKEDYVLTIDIFNFCTITKLFDINGKPKNAYVIKPSSKERLNCNAFLVISQKLSSMVVSVYNDKNNLPLLRH